MNDRDSSQHSTAHTDQQVMYKKRKIDRACDSCRRKKTKCDGPKMSDNVCTNCIQAKKSCTYVESSRPRGPSKAYITGMEDRLERLEALLRKIRPDTDFSEELGPPIIRDSWKSPTDRRSSTSSRNSSSIPHSECSSTLQAYPIENGSPFSHHRVPPPLIHKNSRRIPARKLNKYEEESAASVSDSSSDDDSSTDEECERLQSLIQYPTRPSEAPTPSAPAVRYHGKSSQSALVKITRQFKELRMLESELSKDMQSQPRYRLEFWSAPSWELTWEGLHSESPSLMPSLISHFPSHDLALKLCDIYFTCVNSLWPLLHRPTFDRHFNDKLHHRDHWFACLCMSLFAVASQWCSDLRVIPDFARSSAADGEPDWSHAGMQYLSEALDVHRLRRSLVNITCLFEVQTFTLIGMYWRARNHQHVAWLFVGIGLRKAMDIGVHRKRTYPNEPSVEAELWKRAFWLLVGFDRIDSVALGRSCILQDEDIDVEFPLDVDDEYWGKQDTAVAFRQPKGKPAMATAFNLWIQLTQIVAYTLRTLYAVDMSKSLFGVGSARRRDQVMKHLDAALNDWIEAVPEHLRWTERIKDSKFATQSAIINAFYHSTRILVYRPFMPSPHPDFPELVKEGDLSFSPSSVCIDSAKFLAKIIDHQLKSGAINALHLVDAAHATAATLIRHVWWLKCKEKTQHEDLQDVKPPLAHTIDELMDLISVFTKALEMVASRSGLAAHHLRKIRESLPDGRVGMSSPTMWSDSLQLYTLTTDGTTPPPPSSQDANVWPWYTSAQIQSKSHYTPSPDHVSSDNLKVTWTSQESTPSLTCEMERQGHLPSSPVPSPLPQESSAVLGQQEYSRQPSILNGSRRVSGAGIVDEHPRQLMKTCVNIDAARDPAQAPRSIAYSESRPGTISDPIHLHTLKSANFRNTRYMEWVESEVAPDAAYVLTSPLWNTGSAYFQTSSVPPRRFETPRDHRESGRYSN